LASHQRLLGFNEALIYLSYSGVKVVVPAGNAPASSGYQPGALLLSYETMAEGVGNAPTSAMPILFSRQVQPAYICLPSRNGQGGRSCTCDLLVPNKAVCC
jgi:hypothetical protein